MAGNFPTLMKVINPQIQEAKKNPNRLNTKKYIHQIQTDGSQRKITKFKNRER